MDVAELACDRLPPAIVIPRLSAPFDAEVRPPGSKSITNRVLLLAALAEGESVLSGALIDADDARVMLRALEQLGAEVHLEQSPDERAAGSATVRITGVGGRWRPRAPRPVLDLHNAGTATRFLTASALLCEPDLGPVTIDGNARMRERPIGELVAGLRALGVRVDCPVREGFPPLVVHPPAALDRLRSSVMLSTTQSSQFISALMLVAPFLPLGLELLLQEPVTSASYVEMTAGVLVEAGVRVEAGARVEGAQAAPGHLALRIAHASPTLRAFRADVPPDESGLAFFLAATAIVPGARLRLPGGRSLAPLGGGPGRLVGRAGESTVARPADQRAAFLAAGLGLSGDAITAVGPAQVRSMQLDLSLIPDEAMALSVAACFAPGPSTFTGLKTLRVKETDRLAALQIELTKLGARVEIITTRDDEALRITPPPALGALSHADAPPPMVTFDTYDDHRMAMSLALVGLRRGNVVIRDPACVRKTYPTYWRDLARLYRQGG